MTTCLLYQFRPLRRARYYRIELAMTLFDQVSVLREWGVAGDDGTRSMQTFDNLREASDAADEHRSRMQKRGYDHS